MNTATLAILIGTVVMAYGVTTLSLVLTRRACDAAYFRRRLAHGRLPWIAHIPTYGLMAYGTLYLIGAMTGFPYTLDAQTFMGRNAYSIWALAMALAQVLTGLSLFTIIGVPLVTWLFTQRIPESPSKTARKSTDITPAHPRRSTRHD